MTAPVLSVRPDMTERQVEEMLARYNVRALPVVDDNNDVIGLVSYQLAAAAKQRLQNKEQKRSRRQERDADQGKGGGGGGDDGAVVVDDGAVVVDDDETLAPAGGDAKAVGDRSSSSGGSRGTAVKGWMLQHVQTVAASQTMAEVEAILLDHDVGCIPVVADGTRRLVGVVTRTDLLRQHRYYSAASLGYHNRGYADSIAARQPIIELRKRLKQFDLD